jgi:putative polyketide hydroxylase
MRPGAGARTMTPMPTTDTHTEDVPVLVVGGGPAGLAAAVELARYGITALLVERRLVLSSHPRATVLSLRSMELMRAWGLEAAVRARRVDPVDWRMLEAATLAGAAGGTPLPVGYPNQEQSRALSPVEPACIAQDEVEPLMLAHLRDQRGARVSLGTELTGIWPGADGVRAALRDVRTGRLRSVHARYVVAADGARSAVRRALGVELLGADDVMVGCTTLFRAPLWDVVGPHRHVVYAITREGAPGTFLPAGQADRWMFGLRTEDGEPTDREAVELVRLGAGVANLPVRVERSRTFSAAAQLAERFRAGRVLLAGDAAHRVTPRGGTGLNLALHDGFDLGWKLAWVLRDWAGPDLLDTYEAERRPVVEHTAARSADPRGSIRTAEQEVHADLGGRIRHVWSGGDSTLDLLTTGFTLFAARGGWNTSPAALGSRVPVELRLLDPIAARAVGAAGDSAVLVRPDGKPAAVLPGAGEPVAALRREVRTLATRALSRPPTGRHGLATSAPGRHAMGRRR